MNKALVASLMLALPGWSALADDLDIDLKAAVVRHEIPSGSGMTWHAGRHFVVGDDSPLLFTLDRAFTVTDRSLLKTCAVDDKGRIAKDLKPDFEAMATVAWQGSVWNLILGSGSKKGTRETGLLVSTGGPPVTHAQDLAALYQAFAALARFGSGLAVNIEAVAVADGRVYFFNRGNAGRNLLFKLPVAELMAYMTGQTKTVADIQLHEARLPQLEGKEAGFSGADYWPEIHSLVYTASVEGSDNAYDDGAVLGSYLGLIPLSDLKAHAALDLSRSAKLLTRSGVTLKTKVESVALTHTESRRAQGALVSDNDNGSSEFFEVVLNLGAAKPR